MNIFLAVVVNIDKHAFTHLYLGTYIIIDACEHHPIRQYMSHHVCPA